jgi:hypothetical protein
MVVLWNVAPCSLVDVDRRFRGPYRFHHQGGEAHLKSRSVCTRLHGATSQKTPIVTDELFQKVDVDACCQL